MAPSRRRRRQAEPKAASRRHRRSCAEGRQGRRPSPRRDVIDDISLIGGIGAVLEGEDGSAGYGTLTSISKLKKADIAKLDEEL